MLLSFSTMYRLFFFFITIASLIKNNHSTPLDDYINKPDSAYNWKHIRTYPSSAYTVYVLNMTSQTFFNSKFLENKKIYYSLVITFF